jgi:hypothetical protein
MIIRPPAVEPNSQLQLRLCRWAVRASVVRQYQLHRYFPVGLKVLSLGHFAENGPPQKAGPTRARDCKERLPKVDAWSSSTVFFQGHA